MTLFFLKNFDNTRPFNIADWFSLYRVFITPILVIFLFLNKELIFGILLIVSFLTDAIDGYLARRFKICTERGAYLDSLGDMISLIIALTGLFYFHFSFILEQKVIFIVLFALYFSQIILAYIRYGRPSSFHTYSAKISAIVTFIFFGSIFLIDIWYPLFVFMVIVCFLEEIEEIILILILPKWQTDVKGLCWVVKNFKKQKEIKNI